MDHVKRTEGLDIDEDFAHQRIMWKIERISWVIMTLVILAALAGFLGSGYFSKKVENIGVGSKLEYNFYERCGSPSKLTFHIKAESPNNPVSIAICQEYLEDVEIKRIEPDPESAGFVNGYNRYDFNNYSAKEISIIFYIEPNSIGMQKLNIIINNKDKAEIKQFVYP